MASLNRTNHLPAITPSRDSGSQRAPVRRSALSERARRSLAESSPTPPPAPLNSGTLGRYALRHQQSSQERPGLTTRTTSETPTERASFQSSSMAAFRAMNPAPQPAAARKTEETPSQSTSSSSSIAAHKVTFSASALAAASSQRPVTTALPTRSEQAVPFSAMKKMIAEKCSTRRDVDAEFQILLQAERSEVSSYITDLQKVAGAKFTRPDPNNVLIEILGSRETFDFREISHETLRYSENLFGLDRGIAAALMNAYADVYRLASKAPLTILRQGPYKPDPPFPEEFQNLYEEIISNFEKHLYPKRYHTHAIPSPTNERTLKKEFYFELDRKIYDPATRIANISCPVAAIYFLEDAFYEALHHAWEEVEAEQVLSSFTHFVKGIERLLVGRIFSYQPEILELETPEELPVVLGNLAGGRGSQPTSLGLDSRYIKYAIQQWKIECAANPTKKTPLRLTYSAFSTADKERLIEDVIPTIFAERSFCFLLRECWNEWKDLSANQSPDPLPTPTSKTIPKSILKPTSPIPPEEPLSPPRLLPVKLKKQYVPDPF